MYVCVCQVRDRNCRITANWFLRASTIDGSPISAQPRFRPGPGRRGPKEHRRILATARTMTPPPLFKGASPSAVRQHRQPVEASRNKGVLRRHHKNGDYLASAPWRRQVRLLKGRGRARLARPTLGQRPHAEATMRAIAHEVCLPSPPTEVPVGTPLRRPDGVDELDPGKNHYRRSARLTDRRKIEGPGERLHIAASGPARRATRGQPQPAARPSASNAAWHPNRRRTRARIRPPHPTPCPR